MANNNLIEKKEKEIELWEKKCQRVIDRLKEESNYLKLEIALLEQEIIEDSEEKKTKK